MGTLEEASFFRARTAQILNRLDDSAQLICDFVSSGVKILPKYRRFFMNLHQSLFQKKTGNLRYVSGVLVKPEISSRCKKALVTVESQIKTEISNSYVRFVKIARRHLLSGDDDVKGKIHLYKQIGDSFAMVDGCLQRDTRSDALSEATICYETAVKMAAVEFGVTKIDYLKCVLNWTSFQYKYTDERETAVAFLFKTYSATMKNIDDVPQEEYPETWALLKLMERNMGCWSDHDEEEEAE
jgi:hypothetical protein